MTVFGLVVAAYLIGSLSPSVFIGMWVRGVDIRQHGSGNAGATNAFRVLGTRLGALILSLDVAKGLIPVASAKALVDPEWTVLVGLAAIAGHNYSLFLKGKGGKGVATGAGVLLAMMPLTALLLTMVFGAVLLTFSYVSLASLSAAVGFPVVAALGGQPDSYLLFSIVSSSLVVWAHRANIRRLIRGEEASSGLTWRSLATALTGSAQRPHGSNATEEPPEMTHDGGRREGEG